MKAEDRLALETQQHDYAIDLIESVLTVLAAADQPFRRRLHLELLRKLLEDGCLLDETSP